MAVVEIQTGYLWICDCGAPVGYWVPSNGWHGPDVQTVNCQGCNQAHDVSPAGTLWMPVEKIHVRPALHLEGD